MKTILLAISLLAAGSTSYGQQTQSNSPTKFVTPLPDAPVPMVGEPFPKANIIIVLSPDSVAIAWKAIKQTLLQQGYALAQSDKEMASFSTVPKAPDRKTNVALTINGYVKSTPKGSAIYLFGNWATAISIGYLGGTNIDGEAVFSGLESGGNKRAFRGVEAVAKAHSGGQVGYWLK